MKEPICTGCGKPITETEGDAGNYADTVNGEWHAECLDEAQRDAAAATADYWYDYRYAR